MRTKKRGADQNSSNVLRQAAEARQSLKLAQIREALIAAGCDTTAKQARALGVGRSTAWAMLNRDKRSGPSAVVLKRVLASQNLPPTVRRRIKEYIDAKVAGRYGHRPWFRNQFRAQPLPNRELNESAPQYL